MNILHVAYSLDDSSAATRLAKSQSDNNNIHFLLGRKSKSKYVEDRRVLKDFTVILGVVLHLINIAIVSLLQIKKGEIFSIGIFSWPQKFLLKIIVNSKKIDVINLHWGGYGFFPIQAALGLNVPVIITAHDYNYFTGGCHIPMECAQYNNLCKDCPLTPGKIGKKLVRNQRRKKSILMNGLSPLIVAPSSYTAEKIQIIYPKLKVVVIGNTLDEVYNNLEIFNNKNSEMKIRVPVIITVGANESVRQNKGQDIVEFVFEHLNALGIKFKHILVGSDRGYKYSDCREHYVNVNSIQLRELYFESDLCLVASRFETFSQVALESIACGTPVVAFNKTGPRDIIEDKKTGFLIEAFDIEAYAKAVCENLSYKRCSSDDIANGSERVVKKYSQININEKYILLYREAINS